MAYQQADDDDEDYVSANSTCTFYFSANSDMFVSPYPLKKFAVWGECKLAVQHDILLL